MATAFEAHTHEQLMAMIASVDPDLVRDRATALAEAADAIKEIGEALKHHRVAGWEGEAAEAFRNWVNSAGNATLRLADYGAESAKWMTLAAQHLYEARTTPGVDPAATANLEAARQSPHDPDAAQTARTATAKLEADRLHAAQQLKKLAESYTESTHHLNSAQPPTFPAPPAAFVPRDIASVSAMGRPTGGSDGAAGSADGSSSMLSTSAGGTTVSAPGRSSSGVAAMPSATGSVPVHGPGLPDRAVNVDLSTVGTRPDKTLPPTVGIPSLGPGGTNGFAPQPGVVVPPLVLPPVAGPTNPRGGGAFPRPSVPDGKAGGITALPPQETGLVGGRSDAPRGPGAGISRGTVIGAEEPQAGRGMVGGGMGGGVGVPHGGSGGAAMGRRLATEPGGVVGGRPATGGQPFTQGGSGLVRGAGAGPIAAAPGRPRDGRGVGRPDYLAEDEETWQVNRRVVPPVID